MPNYETLLLFRDEEKGRELRKFYLENCKGNCIPSTENRLLVEEFENGERKGRNFYDGAEKIMERIEELRGRS